MSLSVRRGSERISVWRRGRWQSMPHLTSGLDIQGGVTMSEDEDCESTATMLCELCEQWLEERTRLAGSTSSDARQSERGDDL